MRRRKADEGLDFEALRVGIEHCDPDVMLGFYADDAQLSIVHAKAQRSIPFELHGKTEIAKHLRAAYGHGTSHHVERKIVGEERTTFREACEYPDGSRVVIETTLEVRKGKSDRGPPTRGTSAGVDATLPDRLLRSKQATEKEEIR
jgi:hypothetical protein